MNIGADASSVVVSNVPVADSIWIPDIANFTWDTTTGNTYVTEWDSVGASVEKWVNDIAGDKATYDVGVVGTRPTGVRTPSSHVFKYAATRNTHWTFAFTYTVVTNPTIAAGANSGLWGFTWVGSSGLFICHAQDTPKLMIYSVPGTTNRINYPVSVHKDTKSAGNRNVLLTCVFSFYPSLNKIITIGDLGVQMNKAGVQSIYTGFAPSDPEGVYDGFTDTVNNTGGTNWGCTGWPNAVNIGNGWCGNNLNPYRSTIGMSCTKTLKVGGAIGTATTNPDMYLHEIRLWDCALSATECVNVYHDIRATTIARIPV